jgi:hypothetical protein
MVEHSTLDSGNRLSRFEDKMGERGETGDYKDRCKALGKCLAPGGRFLPAVEMTGGGGSK